MSLIEGIGDEVLLVSAAMGVLTLLFLAWMSTAVHPLWPAESLWLVQMRNSPNRAVIEMTQIDSRQASELATQGQAQMVRLTELQTNSQNINNSLVPETEADARVLNDVIRSATGSSEPAISEPSREREAGIDNGGASQSISEPTTRDRTESTDGPMATIKLKFIDDTSKMVRTWLSNSVAEFKRSHFTDDVSAGRSIRLIFGGQLLRDDTRSLASYGITDESTVHCHVSNRPYRQENSLHTAPSPMAMPTTFAQEPMAPNQFEIGNYMHLIFACKFALLWFFFITYPQYFDLSSFFSLGLCTCVYCAFVGFGRFRRRANTNHGPTSQTENRAAPSEQDMAESPHQQT